MIPQEHTETIWPEEQAPFHVEETPTWRARSRLFRVLGVIVPLMAGLACSIDPSLLLSVWIPFLLGAVSGALFRSWWAVLVVPTALSIGTILSIIFVGGGLPNIADPGFVEGVPFFLVFGVVPAAIGASIDTSIGKEIEQRLQQRATAFKAPIPEHVA